MKDLIVVDDAPVLCSAVSDIELTFCSEQSMLLESNVLILLFDGGLLLKLLVNLGIYSSFKYFSRGHLHEILGLQATGAFSMCVGVHDAAFELMTRQHMTLTDSMAKGTTLGPRQKATSAWQARVDTQGIG